LQAGAKYAGHGLLMFVSPELAQWPPLERNRSKRGKPRSVGWEMRGHGVTTNRRKATHY
jgi:hypothetical protein